ncbi:MAG: phosphatase PAP2 family protein [Huintestinicola sp.]|uniref:phosphatase PAP2 family protein n=1 Tax=Huintestinicola sp. TaxID=2981661 RepID=UPI003F0A53A0
MTNFYNKHCEDYYKKYPLMYDFITSSDGRVRALKLFKTLSTVIMYAAYIILLGFLGASKDMRIIKAVAVPAFVFLLVTAVRKGINAPRPYEKYPIKPVLPKATKGKSCPSRHTACAVVIALACLYVNVPVGIILLVLAVLIAVSRPLMGVHFPLDVIFGAVLAVIPAIIGFYLIP